MKKIFTAFFILSLFASCSSSKETTTISKQNTEEPEQGNKPVRINNYPVK